MSDTPLTIVDIIRHGEPVGGKKYRGQIDDPLSEKGWTQMRESVGEHKPWDIIITSPLIRCAAFAEELSNRHNIDVEVEDRVKEIGWGDWEGKTPAELNAEDPQTVARALSDPMNHRPSNAENINDFFQRVNQAWEHVTEKHKGKHLLIVAHAGVIRAVLTGILNTTAENMFRIHVPNASISRIQIEHHQDIALPKIVFHDGSL